MVRLKILGIAVAFCVVALGAVRTRDLPHGYWIRSALIWPRDWGKACIISPI